MDQARHNMLVEKYGLSNPPPRVPEPKWYSDTHTGPWPIVNAVLDGEQIVAGVWRRGYDNGPLVDRLESDDA